MHQVIAVLMVMILVFPQLILLVEEAEEVRKQIQMVLAEVVVEVAVDIIIATQPQVLVDKDMLVALIQAANMVEEVVELEGPEQVELVLEQAVLV